jgi:hypothetical protein
LKRITAISLSVVLFCAVNVTNVFGQTNVTGHISAEVIESVHTSSKIVTGFELNNEQVNVDTLNQKDDYQDSEILDLGTVFINAGASMTYDVKLNEATLSDSNGNCFTIEPKFTSGLSDTLRIDGSQTLRLNGTAILTKGLASGRYEGSFSLMVVYN